jgi:hypothetical protein
MIFNGRRYLVDDNLNINIVKSADYEQPKKKRTWGQFGARALGALAGGAAGVGGASAIGSHVYDPFGAHVTDEAARTMNEAKASVGDYIRSRGITDGVDNAAFKQTGSIAEGLLSKLRSASERHQGISKQHAGNADTRKLVAQVLGGIGGAATGYGLGAAVTG